MYIETFLDSVSWYFVILTEHWLPSVLISKPSTVVLVSKPSIVSVGGYRREVGTR